MVVGSCNREARGMKWHLFYSHHCENWYGPWDLHQILSFIHCASV
jgi:hypothetical protein